MPASHGALFPLAILTPVLFVGVLLVPLYLGMFTACYIAYAGSGANPLIPHWLDVFFVIDTYSQLLDYWRTNHATLSFTRYALPIIGLPIVCGIFSLWAVRKLARRLRDVFHSYASG